MILRSHAQLHSRGYDERQRNVQMAMRLAVVSDVALAVVILSVRRRRIRPQDVAGIIGAGSLTPSEALSAIFGTIRHKKTLQSAGISPASRSPPPSSAGEHRGDPAGPPRLVPRTLRAGLARLPLGGEPKTPASENYLIVLYPHPHPHPHPERYGRHAAPSRWPAAHGSRSASRRRRPSAKSHTEPLRAFHEQADQGITPPVRRAESQSHARPAPAGEALDAGISTWTAPSAPAKRDEPAQGTPARHSHREKAP